MICGSCQPFFFAIDNEPSFRWTHLLDHRAENRCQHEDAEDGILHALQRRIGLEEREPNEANLGQSRVNQTM